MPTRKIHNKWSTDFRYHGKRYRIKSPINTKAGAQAYENLLLTKAIKGEPIKPTATPKEMTLMDFSDIWFNSYVKANNRPSEILRKKSVFANSLIPFFGQMPLKEINNKKVEEFKAFRLKSISGKTLRNEVSMLSTCLKTAVEWGYLDALPLIKMPKVPQNDFKWLKEDECLMLLQAAEGKIKDMIFLAMKTGMRFGELIAITWPDMDFENKRLTVNKSIVLGVSGPTKNGKIRYIPLTDSVCEHFKGMKKKSGLVFHEDGGGFIHQKNINYHLGRAYLKAGLPPWGWHTLRHTFASHLACKGASILAIKELLGHTDIKTTMRYAHLGPNITTETMKLLS